MFIFRERKKEVAISATSFLLAATILVLTVLQLREIVTSDWSVARFARAFELAGSRTVSRALTPFAAVVLASASLLIIAGPLCILGPSFPRVPSWARSPAWAIGGVILALICSCQLLTTLNEYKSDIQGYAKVAESMFNKDSTPETFRSMWEENPLCEIEAFAQNTQECSAHIRVKRCSRTGVAVTRFAPGILDAACGTKSTELEDIESQSLTNKPLCETCLGSNVNPFDRTIQKFIDEDLKRDKLITIPQQQPAPPNPANPANTANPLTVQSTLVAQFVKETPDQVKERKLQEGMKVASAYVKNNYRLIFCRCQAGVDLVTKAVIEPAVDDVSTHAIYAEVAAILCAIYIVLHLVAFVMIPKRRAVPPLAIRQNIPTANVLASEEGAGESERANLLPEGGNISRT